MKRIGQGVAIAIAAVLLVGTAAGVAFLFLADPGDPKEPESPADVARWCRDVDAAIGPGQPFADVAALTDAILAGDLRAPDDDPPTGSAAEVEAWREANAGFLASSYLGELPTSEAPGDVALSWAVLQLAIDDAHDGGPGYDAGPLGEVATALDEFREARC